METIKHLTQEDFNPHISTGVSLVDFYTTWCGPCKQQSPVLEALQSELPQEKIFKVDAEENRDLALEYGVLSVPTLILFKDGVEVKRMNGFQNQQILTYELERLAH